MVKPAGPYLDVILTLSQETSLPIAAYQVSGEYAMLKAACAKDWLDEPRVALEALLSIRRAGASIILTYYARQAALMASRRPISAAATLTPTSACWSGPDNLYSSTPSVRTISLSSDLLRCARYHFSAENL